MRSADTGAHRLRIGRDPGCDITLADPTVSAFHATLDIDAAGRVALEDAGSANGTLLVRQGQRRPIARDAIAPGDEIEFGDLRVSYEALVEIAQAKLQLSAADVSPRPVPPPPPPVPAPPPKNVPPARAEGAAGPSRFLLSEFNPLAGGLARMRTRGLLVPGIVFALIIARLLQLYQSRATTFVTELAIYTCLGALLLVYRLCGKRKPWLVVGGVMLAELGVLAVLLAPASLVFCTATGIEGPEAPDGLMRSSSFFVRWYAHAVCAGLREELLKMAPVFGLAFLTARAGRVKSSRWGVAEPLDAILYACAAATTFILVETLMQYVPGARKDEAAVALSVIGNQGAAELYGELRAGQLAVIRTLDSLTGHLAYSGYFGYYVGLALMRPAHRHKLVLGGWVAASLVHGFFNASGGPLLRAVATVLAMLLLIAAILNARKLSPTRGDNFATVSLDHVRP